MPKPDGRTYSGGLNTPKRPKIEANEIKSNDNDTYINHKC